MNIRNFAIIAHVDHGKSTLADRFLEITGVLQSGRHEEQFLDRNPISRERGITIKLAPVRMKYLSNFKNSLKIKNLKLKIEDSKYVLNLIDTPGHVDFSYEVDRTLACVEGAILLVDATQGIQAQTIANAYKAIERNLAIIPAVNKIDLPNAKIEETEQQLVDFLGVKEEEIYLISAKTGEGVEKLLKAVVEKIPPPNVGANFNSPEKREISANEAGKQESPIQSLIFDSYYDSHRGVIAFVRVFSGEIKRGDQIKLFHTDEIFKAGEVGYFTPDLKPAEVLKYGEIGYLVTNLKDIHKVQVGDTIASPTVLQPLFGYKKIKPMVFASIFPTDTNDYLNLKRALEKLLLIDSSLEFKSIYSQALGPGFRIGFLGLLHADVVRERLEREFGLSLVLTPPQVEYKGLKLKLEEPWVKVMIVTPQEYVGGVLQLCQNYRAEFITMDNQSQISLIYEMPMSEMISDFYDNLKSISAGYASLDWEFLQYRSVEADRLEILVNGDPIEEFSEIVVKERAFKRANQLTARLKELISRQQYEVKIQGKYKGKIIASTRIAPFRKDVTKKLYGGDRTRKDKLLEKQKEGKKRMKMVGRVEIPKEAFLKLFRRK